MLGVLLAAAVTAVYANHFGNGFHFDDSHTIVNNAFIRNPGHIWRFFTDASTSSSLPANQTYRPLVTTTLAMDYAIGGGLAPWAFHLSIFALFLLQGLAMFFLFRRVLAATFPAATAEATAYAAVAIYLLHPANAETVNYVIARSDTLSTLGIVLALALYACSPRSRATHAYLLPAALGMLAKAVAFVFAPLLLLYETLIGGRIASRGGSARGGARAVRAALPSFVLVLAMLWLIRALSPPAWQPGGTSRYAYFITQPFVILHYFTSFFLPLGLSADTDWVPLGSIADPRAAAGFAFLALLVAAAVLAGRRPRWRPVSFGLGWFLIGLAPTSFVFPLAEVLNDHRVFLPYVGLTLAVAAGGALLLERVAASSARPALVRRAAAAALAGLLCGAGLWTVRRNAVWRTDESLWRDVTLKSPKNGRGWMNYGLALMSRGEYAGAEEAFRKALALTPNYSYVHVNLGVVEAATNRPKEAEESFRRALALGPDRPAPYYFFARFLASRQRPAEAVPLLRTALGISPADLDSRHLLLNILREGADVAELETLAQETLRIAPGDAVATAALTAARQRAAAPGPVPPPEPATPEEWVNLSLREYRAKRFRESIRAAERALALRPGYDVAYNNICAAYNELGEWDHAIAAGEKALALNPSNTLARNNLAWSRKRKAETR
ncbi:MAG TPA: tetratricopeptide repeat protein [bacterium]